MAGRKPARIMRATSVGPMAAHKPASDPIAKEAMPVTIMQQGRRKIPSLFKGFVRRLTRCRSHFVVVTQAAKPIEKQIEIIRAPVVIDLSNWRKAIIGSSDTQHMASPPIRSVSFVS